MNLVSEIKLRLKLYIVAKLLIGLKSHMTFKIASEMSLVSPQ